MKRRILFLGLFACLAVLIGVWFQTQPASERSAVSTNTSEPSSSGEPLVPWEDDDGNEIMIPESELPELIREERRAQKEISDRFAAQWKTPIAFYGKVIDNEGNPVSGAEIRVGVNDTSRTGTSEFVITSQDDGSFLISGIQGKHLHIEVAKDGFLSGKDSFRSFAYAGGYNPFTPNPLSPELFRLQKRGDRVPLITQNQQLRVTPHQGRVTFDLFRLKSPAETIVESIEVTYAPSDRKDAKGTPLWSYSVRAPRGKIQERKGEFNFQAPVEGYLDSFTEEIPYNQLLDKRFFVSFSNGLYGAFSISFGPGSDTMFLSSNLNPDGSTNLEYDRQLRIQVRSHLDGSISLIYPEGHEPKTPSP